MATCRIGAAVLLAVSVAWTGCAPPPAVIHSVGPGVWARELPLGTGPGANQGWIEFDSFVLVVDANVFDTELALVDEIRKTTPKPIRFVVDTHHHGDHAHGNGRLAAMGAEVIAAVAARESYARTERDFKQAKDEGHQAYDDTDYVAPTIWFESTLSIAEESRRVELLHLGAAHTPGDTLVWVPEQGILFSGDVVATDHLTFLGDGSIESWIGVLKRLEELPVRVVIPGHGPPGDPETIRTQRDFLTDLRDAVVARLEDGESDPDSIAETLELPDHPLWSEQQRWFRKRGVLRVLREHGTESTERVESLQ